MERGTACRSWKKLPRRGWKQVAAWMSQHNRTVNHQPVRWSARLTCCPSAQAQREEEKSIRTLKYLHTNITQEKFRKPLNLPWIIFYFTTQRNTSYILIHVLLSHTESAVCYTRGQMATTTGWKQTKQAPAFPHLKSGTHVTNRSNEVAKKTTKLLLYTNDNTQHQNKNEVSRPQNGLHVVLQTPTRANVAKTKTSDTLGG